MPHEPLTRGGCSTVARLRSVLMCLGLMGCPQLLEDGFWTPVASTASGGSSGSGGVGGSGSGSRVFRGGVAGGGASVAGSSGMSGAASEGPGPGPSPSSVASAGASGCSDSVQSEEATGDDCDGVCPACACAAFGPFATPEPITGLGRSGELWGASLSADGRWLAFAESSAGLEDVYLAERDTGGSFLAARAASGINTLANEGTPALSSDGRSLYFYSSRGAVGGRDIYVATRPSPEQDHGGATLVPGLNSVRTDHLPWISRDELRIYFASTRDGGAGSSDIYTAARESRGAPFSAPENVAELNGADTDDGAALASDELSLLFPSNRSGDFAIWGAARPATDEPFGEPQLVEELDSPGYEGNVALSSDGLEVIFTSDRDGSFALYRALRECL